MKDKELTIEQQLFLTGFSHERTVNSSDTGKHLVIRIIDGEIMGEFTAEDSLSLLTNK